MQGIPPVIPGISQNIAQGMPPGMSQGMNQGMSQFGAPAPFQPPHNEMNRNEDEFVKEAENINNFLNTINECQLPISDKVINNICAQAGFSTTDPRLSRLLSLACEYFIIFAVNQCRKVAANNRTDLQLSDVKKALEKLNVNIYRPEYIVNTIESEQANIDDNQMFDYIEDTQMFD